MLRWRLISASVIISTLIFLMWLDIQMGTEAWLGRPGIAMSLVTLVIGLMATSEMLSFMRASHTGVKPIAVYAGTALVIGMSCIPVFYANYPADCPVGRLGWPMFGMAAAIGIAFVSQMIGYKPGDKVMDDVARTVMIVAYIGLLLGFWASIRSCVDNHWGIVALLSMIVTVKVSDSCAYGVGKMIGKNKLAPNLSPGKTIEGLAGGLVGGIFGAMIVFYFVAPMITGESSQAPWWMVVLFGLAVTIAGIIGDLSESLLKRDGGVKDSSRWLPGLGGIMDIIDSLLPAGPVVLAFWTTGMFGPVAS